MALKQKISPAQINAIDSLITYHFMPIPGNELDAIIIGIAELIATPPCLGKRFVYGTQYSQNPQSSDYVMAFETPQGTLAVELIVVNDLVDIRFVSQVFRLSEAGPKYLKYEVNTRWCTCDGLWLSYPPIKSNYNLADLNPQEIATNIERLLQGSPSYQTKSANGRPKLQAARIGRR